MLVLLRLDDVHNKQRNNLKRSKIKNCLKKLCNKTCRPPWVAEIVSEKRIFIRGHWDYEHVNYQGTRNIVVSFFLKEGRKYEIFESKTNERYFCKIKNGKIVKQ